MEAVGLSVFNQAVLSGFAFNLDHIFVSANSCSCYEFSWRKWSSCCNIFSIFHFSRSSCQTSTLSLRGILQLLRQDANNSPHRRRRPRFVRRAVRRMRRWGLIPRPASRPTQASSSTQQQSDTAPASQDPAQSTPTRSSSGVEAVNQPVPQKLGLLAQSEQHQQEVSLPPLPLPPPPPVTSPPPPPYAPPAPPPAASHTPPVVVPPSSPSLASIFHSLGLSIPLFRASPASSSTNFMALSASSSFSSSSSDDDVLLIPLSEDTTSEDDVPMLTWTCSPPLTHTHSFLLYVLCSLITETQSFHVFELQHTGLTARLGACLVPF